MKNEFNTKYQWDALLSDKNYLLDLNTSVKVRCNYVAKLIKKISVDNIINVGSGQGYLERIMGNSLNEILWISMDISVTGLRNLKRFHVNRILGYAHRIPIKNISIDCCISMEMLEHVPKNKVNLVYKEFKRIMKSDSYLVVSTPIFEPMPLKFHPVGHLRKYTPNGIRQELVQAGFEICENYEIFSFESYYWIKKIICKLLRLRRPSVILLICRKK